MRERPATPLTMSPSLLSLAKTLRRAGAIGVVSSAILLVTSDVGGATDDSWWNTRGEIGWPPQPKVCSIHRVYFGGPFEFARTEMRFDAEGRLVSYRHTLKSKADPKPTVMVESACTYTRNIASCIDGNGRRCDYIADDGGRIAERRCTNRQGKAEVTKLTYDVRGVAREPGVKRFYDDRGRLVEMLEESRVNRFAYDKEGRRISKRIFQKSESKPREVITYLWGANHRLLGQVDRIPFTTQLSSYSYDEHGRLASETSMEIGAALGDASLREQVAYSYDCLPAGTVSALDCNRWGDCP